MAASYKGHLVVRQGFSSVTSCDPYSTPVSAYFSHTQNMLPESRALCWGAHVLIMLGGEVGKTPWLKGVGTKQLPVSRRCPRFPTYSFPSLLR